MNMTDPTGYMNDSDNDGDDGSNNDNDAVKDSAAESEDDENVKGKVQERESTEEETTKGVDPDSVSPREDVDSPVDSLAPEEGVQVAGVGLGLKILGKILGKKKGPKANDGKAKKHGNDKYNDAIDEKIKELKKDPEVKNIRKNQQQVDVEGNKVGRNRPDVQYGCHNCVEYDNVPKNSKKHGETIRNNDPDTNIDLHLL